MCYTYYELNGKPAIKNDRTTLAAKLIDEVYECENGGAGGYAHIVIDDWNLDDDNIDWCIENTKSGGYQEYGYDLKQACLKCLSYLKSLSNDERYSAMAIHEQFI